MNQTATAAMGKESFMEEPTSELIEKIREFQRLKEKAKGLEGRLDAVKRQVALLEQELLLLLDNSGIESIRVNGKMLFQRTDRYMSITPDQQEEAFTWLIEKDLAELIKPTVNGRSLSSALKEMDDEEIPDCIQVSKVRRIGMRAR